MDVLAPDLIWIDGRCYRTSMPDSAFSSNSVAYNHGSYLQDETGDIDCEYEESSDMPDIEIASNGRYSMIFPVAGSFMPFIIGTKGATIKRLSKDTSCKINRQKLFDKQQCLTIFGPSKNQVILAWKSIQFIIKRSRKKLEATHFLSIPLNCDGIQQNFIQFKENILSTCNDENVTEKLFQSPEKLHMTIYLLVLADDKERKMAEDKFMEVINKIVKPMLESVKPCTIQLKGLEIMNDDPTRVKVVYTNAVLKNNEQLLQDMCNKICEAFSSLGFSKEDRLETKIHVTVMNVSFLYKENNNNFGTSYKNNQEKYSFDATNILKKYKDFYFGDMELTSIHLSTRFTTDVDGYYKHIARVEI